MRTLADRAVKQGAPKYRRADGASGDEQLWQREVGNTMPHLAMAYLMTGDRQYLDAAKQWALASCDYPTWGYGRFDGMDLATGHQLFGLAIVYDWCYRDLDDASRQHIRETLAKRASAMFQAAATGNTYWHRSYMQNHLWVNICGLSAAGFALFDEDPQARHVDRFGPGQVPPHDGRRSAPTAPATKGSAIGSTGPSTCSSSCTWRTSC